jgi:ribosomal protein L11 methyltransferase
VTRGPKLHWLEVSVTVSEEACDAVEKLFNRFGKGGAVVEGRVFGQNHRSRLDRMFMVKAYLSSNAQPRNPLQAIEQGLDGLRKAYVIPKAEVRELGMENWTEGWKKGFSILRIGERLVVVPTWKTYLPRKKDIVIRMDPGMAFGSGLHPTTRLCLIALEHYLKAGDLVLDVGTGSGIQAIAAAKLGAERITALDTESVAVETAGKNAALNGVSDRIELHAGTVGSLYSKITPAHLIVVNILAYTIIDLLLPLREKLLPGGIFIGGGILDEYVREVEDALKTRHFTIVERLVEEEWVTLVAKNRPTHDTA